jgi:hypothetical protein
LCSFCFYVVGEKKSRSAPTSPNHPIIIPESPPTQDVATDEESQYEQTRKVELAKSFKGLCQCKTKEHYDTCNHAYSCMCFYCQYRDELEGPFPDMPPQETKGKKKNKKKKVPFYKTTGARSGPLRKRRAPVHYSPHTDSKDDEAMNSAVEASLSQLVLGSPSPFLDLEVKVEKSRGNGIVPLTPFPDGFFDDLPHEIEFDEMTAVTRDPIIAKKFIYTEKGCEYMARKIRETGRLVDMQDVSDEKIKEFLETYFWACDTSKTGTLITVTV